MDHYCRAESETSGKYAPCKIKRAGRGIMVAGWHLVKDAIKMTTMDQLDIFLWGYKLEVRNF